MTDAQEGRASSTAPGPTERFRPPYWPIYLVTGVPMLIASAITLAKPQMLLSVRLLGAAFLVPLLIVMFRTGLSFAELGPDELRIRNPFWSYRLRWEDIDDVTDHLYAPISRGVTTAAVVTPGRVIPIFAIQRPHQNHWMLERLKVRAAQHHH